MPFVAKANPKVTSESVEAACDELGAGRVTLRAVRDRVGGSMRDVAPLVKRWRDMHPPSFAIPETSELAAQISTRLAAEVAQSSEQLDRWRQEQKSESAHWRREIESLRDAIDALRRQQSATPSGNHADTNVVALAERAAPPELNTALTRLNARLDQLELGLAERETKLPAAIESTLTAISSNAEASAEKIVQALTDLPQTLRQAPVSRVDANLNERLEATVFELTSRAAELVARTNRSGDVIAALERIDAAAARRQQTQSRRTAAAQDALLARIDALVSVIATRPAPTAGRKSGKKKPTLVQRKAKTPKRQPRRAPPPAKAPRGRTVAKTKASPRKPKPKSSPKKSRNKKPAPGTSNQKGSRRERPRHHR